MSSVLAGVLSAAGQPLARSAYGVVAKAARGFQVFRVDGYSLTKVLPGGERITSRQFTVGDRHWQIDYYPNGTDASKDSADSIALYLRLVNHYSDKAETVWAHYKFSLLDLDGNEAYQVPAQAGTFVANTSDKEVHPGCGYASFITKEDMEMRRDSLLKADSLAIRCDVGVFTSEVQSLEGTKQWRPSNHSYSSDDDSEWIDDDGRRRRRRRRRSPRPPLDDKEYVRRCLTAKR